MKKNNTNKQLNGLAGAYEAIQLQEKEHKQNAKKLFLMVNSDKGSTADLQRLVTHGSLLELIFFTIDLTRSSKAKANQTLSKLEAKASKASKEVMLYGWLEINIDRFKGNLDSCVIHAVNALPKLGRSEPWVRKQITAYRKSKK